MTELDFTFEQARRLRDAIRETREVMRHHLFLSEKNPSILQLLVNLGQFEPHMKGVGVGEILGAVFAADTQDMTLRPRGREEILSWQAHPEYRYIGVGSHSQANLVVIFVGAKDEYFMVTPEADRYIEDHVAFNPWLCYWALIALNDGFGTFPGLKRLRAANDQFRLRYYQLQCDGLYRNVGALNPIGRILPTSMTEMDFFGRFHGKTLAETVTLLEADVAVPSCQLKLIIQEVQHQQAVVEEVPPAKDFVLCPITGAPMKHPVVITKTGYSYEKEALQSWFLRAGRPPRCPMTNILLEDHPFTLDMFDRITTPNRALEDAIATLGLFERENSLTS